MWIRSRKKNSGGGGGGTGVSLIVTCATDFAGKTITCSDGTITFTETCPSSSPYEVEFTGISTGNWTISGEVGGETYMTSVTINDATATLLSFLTNVSYTTAYGAANSLVTKGTHRLSGTLDHNWGGGGNYNLWYSDSNNITDLTPRNMSSNFQDTTFNLFNNDITVTNSNGCKLTKLKFNKAGYIVYAFGHSANMTDVKNEGNIFNFKAVKANDEMYLNYNPTNLDDVSHPFNWLTFYPEVSS